MNEVVFYFENPFLKEKYMISGPAELMTQNAIDQVKEQANRYFNEIQNTVSFGQFMMGRPAGLVVDRIELLGNVQSLNQASKKVTDIATSLGLNFARCNS